MSHKNGNIFLVGPMGSGKSTIGRLVALDFGHVFYDADKEIERISEKTIKTLFAEQDENWFRDLEERYLSEITAHSPIVLSTGGGAVLRSLNRSRLRKRGVVIYLKAEAHILYERLKDCCERPLLFENNRRDWLVKMVAERDHFYTETAHHVVDVAEKSVAQITSEIKQCLLSH